MAGPADDVRGVLRLRRLRDVRAFIGQRLLRGAVPLAVLLAVPRRLRRGLAPTSASRSPGSRSRPALIILIFPLGFRMTCYYYRKAYYRAFWLSPPACAVAEPHGSYSGETRFPLILQNIHRYFWYAAVAGRAGPDLRRGPGVRPPRASRRHPHGPRHAADADQRRLHLALHAVVPLLPARRRRPAAALLEAPGPLQALDLGVEAERQARRGTRGYSLFSVALVDLYICLLATGTIDDPRFF